jgi:glycosyltransferase involved in cell wall biosynthesis
MACGRPVVVAADEPYAQALVTGGVCAAADRTPAAMAERVVAVVAGRDPALGRRARAHAEAHWALDTMVARYLALLEALLRPAR